MEFTRACLQWLTVILQERFGQAFILTQPKTDVLLLALSENGQSIQFGQLQAAFHQPGSNFSCAQWQASVEGYSAPIDDLLPAPSEGELPSPLIEYNETGVVIHYDILGLTYWMLTRLEEVGHIDLDNHNRFSAVSAHAFKHGYLERPIVDEWLNILGQVIQRVWPQLELKQHRFSIKVSHDVDAPTRFGFAQPEQLVRGMVASVIKNRDIKTALLAPWIRLNTKTELHPADPYNTFDWIMDVSERHGLKSAFYFICGRTDPQKDADYEPEHPAIRELMRRIFCRGHEVGLHPSYNSFQQPDLIAAEASRLWKICKDEYIQQAEWGGRMHYLRWEHAKTLQAWENAGLSYDSTLGYASLAGFRCGTCFEYPAFNPETEKQLNLRIRPLIAMERTVIASHYMGLGTGDVALSKFLHLKNMCRLVGGSFTLLWHNTQLCDSASRKLYQDVIAL